MKDGKPRPNGFVEVEHDETTGKTVGWEPWSQSPFAKYIEEARKNWAVLHPLPDPYHSDLPSGTYELIGPKINGNPEGCEQHQFARHGYTGHLDEEALTGLVRDFEGIRSWLADHRYWEGIVFHHPDGRMAKIKRKDFRA